jgi:hypothetical protein
MIDLDGERWSLGEKAPGQREDGEQSEGRISFTHEEAILSKAAACGKRDNVFSTVSFDARR